MFFSTKYEVPIIKSFSFFLIWGGWACIGRKSSSSSHMSCALDDDDTIMRAMHLQNVLDQLTFYSQQDLEIFKSRIQACLNEELRMVALCGASQGDPSFMSGSATELIEQIDEQQKNSISRHITELLNRIS